MTRSKLVAYAGTCCAVILAGCGGGLSGTYKQTSGMMAGIIDASLIFSGSTVQIKTDVGTSEAAYKVDGKQVRISADGKTSIFTIDSDGCLDAGSRAGKFCKVK